MNEWMNDSISHSFGKECLKFNSSNSGVEFVRLKSWHVEKKDKSFVCVYIYIDLDQSWLFLLGHLEP